MPMFMGEYNHSIDAKGRLFVPAKFREELGDNFVVSAGLDGCLYLSTQNYFEEFAQNLAALPFTREAREMQRHFLMNASNGEIDKQGRILIPAKLKELANLTKDVVIVGVIKKIEIWDKETLEKGIRDKSMEDIAEKMSAEYGLRF